MTLEQIKREIMLAYESRDRETLQRMLDRLLPREACECGVTKERAPATCDAGAVKTLSAAQGGKADRG